LIVQNPEVVQAAAPTSPPPDGAKDRRTLREEFLETCAGVFDRFVSSDGRLYGDTFSEIEALAEESFRSLARLLCQKRLQADPRSRPDQAFTCPRCSRSMRTQNPGQRRTLASTLGEVEVIRPYCVCDGCGFSCAPLDYALGIPSTGPSVGRRELVCHAATKDRSFDKASETLRHYSHLCLSDEAIRKLAESEGRTLVEARARRVDECFQKRGQIARSPADPAAVLVVVCDGGMVQTRNKEQRWKSDKIGCVYDAVPHPDHNAARAEHYQGAAALTKTYVATIETWERMGRMLFAEACARGYLDAPVKLFISDGAGAIITLRELHFPDAHAIIDWYHATEHLHDCAKAAFAGSTSEAQAWAEGVIDALWNGDLSEVIKAIAQQGQRVGPPPVKASDTDPRRVLRRNVGYFTERQNQMDYPTYRAKGWPIGSGVAEGSVKQFGLRVKGSEKFWNLEGVEEMLALCELYFSQDDRWDQYWTIRSRPPEDGVLFHSPSRATQHDSELLSRPSPPARR